MNNNTIEELEKFTIHHYFSPLKNKPWWIYILAPIDYWDEWESFTTDRSRIWKPTTTENSKITYCLEKILPVCGFDGFDEIREGWFYSDAFEPESTCLAVKQDNNGTTFLVANIMIHTIPITKKLSQRAINIIEEINGNNTVELFKYEEPTISLVKAPPPPQKGQIYFVEALGLDKIKIGYSTDPEDRQKNLQTGSPTQLKLITTINGDKNIETQLHNKFRHLHMQGEWFHATKELKGYIENLHSKSALDINRELASFRE